MSGFISSISIQHSVLVVGPLRDVVDSRTRPWPRVAGTHGRGLVHLVCNWRSESENVMKVRWKVEL